MQRANQKNKGPLPITEALQEGKYINAHAFSVWPLPFPLSPTCTLALSYIYVHWLYSLRGTKAMETIIV